MFEPTGVIYFISNAPVDATRQNVLDFPTSDSEASYFMSISKMNLDRCRPFDVLGFSGSLIVPLEQGTTIDDFYDINYIMYRNETLSNKWFYAYIGTPQPKGSESIFLPYVIDLWRTWHWDVTYGTCLVAREHVSDDTYGKWLLPEDIETGEFLQVPSPTGTYADPQPIPGYDIVEAAGLDTTPTVIIANSLKEATDDDPQDYGITEQTQGLLYQLIGMAPGFAGGTLSGGIFQGCIFQAFPINIATLEQDIETINTYIAALIKYGQIDRVLNPIRMVPKWMCSGLASGGTQVQNTNLPFTVEVNALSCPTTFGSYTPHNNKLFTQPYNYFIIDTGCGASNEYGYEYFDGSPSFELQGQISMSPQSILIPNNYKGSNGVNWLYKLPITDYPVASFSYSRAVNDINATKSQNAVNFMSDVFNTGIGLANSAIGAANSITSGAASIAAGGAVGGAAGAAIGAAGAAGDIASSGLNLVSGVGNAFLGVASTLAKYTDTKRIPNSVAGSGNGNITFPNGRMTYTQYRMQISEHFARTVDAFFDAYGYRVDTFKVPQFSSRPNWNYCKCVNPVVLGNAPISAKDEIANMLSNGLRVWHNPSTWMNYDAPNQV